MSAHPVQNAIQNAVALTGGVNPARASITQITETTTYCDVVVSGGEIADVSACPVNAGVIPLWRFLVKVDLSTGA